MKEKRKSYAQNILDISYIPIYPIDTGGRSYIYSCISRLINNKFKVSLICPRINNCITEKESSKFKIIDKLSTTLFKFLSPITLYYILKEAKKHDTIIFDCPWFIPIFGFILRILGRKIEMREQNIEFLRFKSYNNPLWILYFLYEKFSYNLSNKIRFISESDKELAFKCFNLKNKDFVIEEFCPDITRFFPSNKYKSEIRRSLNLEEKEKFILFFGSLNYTPNLYAIQTIKDEIIPRLNKYKILYKIVVCGKNPPSIYDSNIIYTGFVEKIERYIQSCDVMINPITSGGGVKTKVVETLACETKVISTKEGAEGIPISELLIIADNWDNFCMELIN